MSDLATDFHERILLDHTKISWHMDKVRAWERGEWFSPCTVDLALRADCNFGCGFCYATLQKNKGQRITKEAAMNLIEDLAEVGVRGVSLVSDGESTLHPAYVPFIQRGAELGVSMASGTNAFIFDEAMLEAVLPSLTYLRVNFSAGEPKRYAEIMGTKEASFDRVCENIKTMVRIKRRDKLAVTLGMQMVLMPQDADQVLPFARLGRELGVDYNVIKHTSDGPRGELGVDYSKYPALYDLLREAEALSTPEHQISVKWTKIKDGNVRSYTQCYGAAFLLQISGTGLLAPCGMAFATEFKDEFHIGNVVETRFRDLVRSDRYWAVMRHLASKDFSTDRCGQLCLQHLPNVALDRHVKGLEILQQPEGAPPRHLNFI